MKKRKNRTTDNKGFNWWNESPDHDPQHCILQIYMVFVLRDFIITKLLSFQTCLVLKSYLLLLIHSRPFFRLRLPYFMAIVSLVHFLSLFSSEKARDLHLCHPLFIIYYNEVPIQHAIRLVEKACFIWRVLVYMGL